MIINASLEREGRQLLSSIVLPVATIFISLVLRWVACEYCSLWKPCLSFSPFHSNSDRVNAEKVIIVFVIWVFRVIVHSGEVGNVDEHLLGDALWHGFVCTCFLQVIRDGEALEASPKATVVICHLLDSPLIDIAGASCSIKTLAAAVNDLRLALGARWCGEVERFRFHCTVSVIEEGKLWRSEQKKVEVLDWQRLAFDAGAEYYELAEAYFWRWSWVLWDGKMAWSFHYCHNINASHTCLTYMIPYGIVLHIKCHLFLRPR